MGEWAHEVRLGANLFAHPNPDHLVAPEDAEELLGFTEVILDYLYVMPARLLRRKAGDRVEDSATDSGDPLDELERITEQEAADERAADVRRRSQPRPVR